MFINLSFHSIKSQTVILTNKFPSVNQKSLKLLYIDKTDQLNTNKTKRKPAKTDLRRKKGGTVLVPAETVHVLYFGHYYNTKQNK